MAGPRQSNPIPLTFSPGLYTNETDKGASGRWIDGDNIRWNDDGIPEKMGGYIVSGLVDPDGVAVTYVGKVRSTWEWDSLDGETWIAFGTACKLYLINRGVLYDITPLRIQTTVVNGFTTTNLSTTVTIHDPGHGATEGDHLRISGASAVGGITLLGEYDVESVIDLDNYTVIASAAASSGATGGGTATIKYDISCGLESDGPLFGYGVGPYGAGTFGTPRTTSDFIGRGRVWSLDNWGEDLMASPSGETLYVWRRVTGPDSRALVVPNAPDNIERMMVGPDDRHVIALGTNLASTGQHDKMFVRWCKGDDYDTWLGESTNDAGSKRLDTGSRLVTGLKTRNGILIFSDKTLYFLSLIGGTDVYQIIPAAGETLQIISPEAAVDIDGVAHFMGKSDFYYFDGVLHVLDCDIRTKVFGTKANPGINRAAQSKVHCRLNKEFNEIWWSYPSANSAENDSVAIYNYALKCWYFTSTPREAGHDSSPSLDDRPYAFYSGRFWIHEEGVDGDDGAGFVVPLHAFIKSYQGQVAEGAVEVRVNRLIPDFDEMDGLLDVYVTGREYPQSAEQSYGPKIVLPTTEYVCPDLRVRQVSIKIDSNDLGVFFRMGTWSMYATPVTRKSG